MRKIIWLILILIAILWIAIAQFWTGSENTVKTYDFPEATPTVTIEISEALPDPGLPTASPSAGLEATPSAEPSPKTTPNIFP